MMNKISCKLIGLRQSCSQTVTGRGTIMVHEGSLRGGAIEDENEYIKPRVGVRGIVF